MAEHDHPNLVVPDLQPSGGMWRVFYLIGS
jgi:hypothetical protein